jgi:hypothetical protein
MRREGEKERRREGEKRRGGEEGEEGKKERGDETEQERRRSAVSFDGADAAASVVLQGDAVPSSH